MASRPKRFGYVFQVAGDGRFLDAKVVIGTWFCVCPDVIVESVTASAHHPQPVIEYQAHGFVPNGPLRIDLYFLPAFPVAGGPDIIAIPIMVTRYNPDLPVIYNGTVESPGYPFSGAYSQFPLLPVTGIPDVTVVSHGIVRVSRVVDASPDDPYLIVKNHAPVHAPHAPWCVLCGQFPVMAITRIPNIVVMNEGVEIKPAHDPDLVLECQCGRSDAWLPRCVL